jgi:hypothetical protein
MVKPFPDRPLCKSGVGNVSVLNKASAGVSFCQTTYPGDESPVIPTWIPANSKVGLAVNGPDYWMGTGTAYYVNYPGIPPKEACIWGKKPMQVAKGNWAPIQFSAQQDATGMTYLTLGHNPVTWEPDFHAPLRNNFGVRIRCKGKCVTDGGFPCEINPKKHGLNHLNHEIPGGAGGANYCVTTLHPGSTAVVEVYEV